MVTGPWGDVERGVAVGTAGMKVRSHWGVVLHPRCCHLSFVQWLEVLFLLARRNPPSLPSCTRPGFTPSQHAPPTPLH